MARPQIPEETFVKGKNKIVDRYSVSFTIIPLLELSFAKIKLLVRDCTRVLGIFG